jgi:hypothetical protein
MQLIKRLIESLIFGMWKIAAICAFVALFVFPLTIHQAAALLPVVIGILCCVALWYFGAANRLTVWFFKAGSPQQWLVAIMIAALLVRIPVMIWPSPLYSDMFYYHRAAAMLAHGAAGAWGRNGLGIFYAPGESLWLAPWIALFGDHGWVIPASNTFLTLAALPLLYAAFATVSQAGARASTAMLALFPSLVLWSGTAGHESAEICILAILLFLYTRIVATATLRRALLLWVAFGFVFGAGSLVRPTFPLLFAMTVITVFVKSSDWRRATAGPLLALVCATVIIAPWTIRNYREYGRFCLIAANGGTSLLGVVDPHSNGIDDYIPTDFAKGIDIVERDRLSMRRAVHFIAADPQRIARLAVIKFVREWGSDVSSSIDAVVGVPPRGGETVKHAIQAALTLFYAAFVCAWMLASLPRRPEANATPVGLWCSSWVLITIALHLVFPALARYHYSVLPLAAGVAGSACAASVRKAVSPHSLSFARAAGSISG